MWCMNKQPSVRVIGQDKISSYLGLLEAMQC
jgi:hypothetical protein